jgi:transcriptional regulator of heat shock response
MTAVEYIQQEFLKKLTDENYNISFDEIIEKAKAMNKEQIIDAHIEGQRVFDKHDHTQWTNDQAEQYYNETYKNK